MKLPNSRLPSATESFSPALGGADLNTRMKPLMSPPAQNVPLGAAHHDRAGLAILLHQVGERGQVAHHVAVDRVRRFGAVERDVQRTPAALQQQGFEARKIVVHCATLFETRPTFAVMQ